MDRRILLQDVLDKMQKSNLKGIKTPFHIQFVTCDEGRGTGGEKKIIKRGVLMDGEEAEMPGTMTTGMGKPKRPNHYEHSTRNIIDLDDPSKHPVKIHIRLIVMFDHKYVYW